MVQSFAIRKKLSEEVRDRLEEMIREGVYPIGETLPAERQLMEMFNVGRPSIREALFALERMGLVKINTGERARVIQPTPTHFLNSLSGAARMLLDQPQGVGHFEQSRLFLEESLARHAAECASSAEIAALEEALEHNRSMLGKARAFALSDVAFHRTLAGIPANPIFIAVHDAFVEWLISQRPLPSEPELANRRSFAGHVAVVEAIRARDPERAGRMMRQHLDDARQRHRDDAAGDS